MEHHELFSRDGQPGRLQAPALRKYSCGAAVMPYIKKEEKSVILV